MSKTNNVMTVHIPLRMPKVSQSGKCVLFGTASGKIDTPYGEMRISANLYAPLDDADTAEIIGKVKALPGLGSQQNVKAAKALEAKEARQTVLKALQDLPSAA